MSRLMNLPIICKLSKIVSHNLILLNTVMLLQVCASNVIASNDTIITTGITNNSAIQSNVSTAPNNAKLKSTSATTVVTTTPLATPALPASTIVYKIIEKKIAPPQTASTNINTNESISNEPISSVIPPLPTGQVTPSTVYLNADNKSTLQQNTLDSSQFDVKP